MKPSVFEAPPLEGHALLDSGGGEKLERFGPVVLRRPDPQALWRRRLDDARWAAADLTFVRESDRGGRWEARPGAPDEARGEHPAWTIRQGEARLLIRPTPFKHVGLFPEQAANWALVERLGEELEGRPLRLLNLFGYSGAASVLAARAGWEVTHVDASKASITWAVDNAEASGLGRSGMRVVCEDALRFARREVRRGSTYDVVLMDPPHYGRGPKGEVWRLEEHLAELVEVAGQLANPAALVVLSTYAVGHSPLALQNLFGDLDGGSVQAGELAIPEAPAGEGAPRRLPAGFCARWARGCAHDREA
ncbi:MAG: RsmD family RNA methyltransferase [Planctomycetota bacterium]